MLLYYSLAAGLPFLALTNAATFTSGSPIAFPTAIVGTWSSKSNKTLTGPGFFNPVSDELIEPERTGISYSFTDDGYYEEAYFRAIANPTNPACPEAIMQWQHGSYEYLSNGSLVLTPIAVDGRQLLSAPCESDTSTYIRYNQSEYFQSFSQFTDPYHNIPRLDLYEFDGTPMMPLYLVYSPPTMLPTTTLNPLTTATGTAKGSSKLRKRGADMEVPLNWKAKLDNMPAASDVVHHINADRLWWIGIGMTGIGGLLYMGPRRMGIQL